MLKQRVITAVVLLAVLLPALFASNPLFFHAIVLAMVSAGAWEWGRLNGLGTWAALGSGALGLIAGLLTYFMGGLQADCQLLWLVAGLAWVVAGVVLLRLGVAGWGKLPFALRWPVGLLALWVAGLAMVQAHGRGLNFLFSVLLLVWVADVFAYFAGRAFGQRLVKVKLAPSISPGKSWEGAIGGALGVLLMGVVWAVQELGQSSAVPVAASLYARLLSQGWWLLLLGCVFLTAMSVVGDLVESLVKRSAGMKDSSQLLPGHGGVLDRIDALLPTLPLAMLLANSQQIWVV